MIKMKRIKSKMNLTQINLTPSKDAGQSWLRLAPAKALVTEKNIG